MWLCALIRSSEGAEKPPTMMNGCIGLRSEEVSDGIVVVHGSSKMPRLTFGDAF